MAVGPAKFDKQRHWKMRQGRASFRTQSHLHKRGLQVALALGLATVMKGRGDRGRRFPTAQNHGRSLLLDIPLWLSWAKCGLGASLSFSEGTTPPQIFIPV